MKHWNVNKHNTKAEDHMTRKTFLKGALILGIAGLLVQVMGAIFRIPLANIIGDDGMGYYQTAYPIYIFLLVFSTNGAPAAISKMTSERIAIGNRSEAHRVFKLSFILMFILGIGAASFFFFGAGWIVGLLKNPGAYYSMVAIAPALLFVPIMAVYRGYFQGLQEMAPTALSQLVEQAVRVAVGLGLAFLLVSKGIEYAAAGASFGTSIGPLAGTGVLILLYYGRKKKLFQEMNTDTLHKRESARVILMKLAAIAVPITIGVSILPIMNIVDVSIVMRRLQETGFSAAEANALYGQLSGMAGPIINIPQALAMSIALSLVPSIAASKSVNDTAFLQKSIALGFRSSIIIGVPCTFGLMALSSQIMMLLYPLQIESAASGAESLFILSIGILFLAVAQTMAGILQGLGRPSIAVLTLGAGVLVKIVATSVLTGIPSLNIQGAAIGSTLAYATVGILNFIIVKRSTGTHFDLRLSLFKPVLAGIAMSICVLAVYYGCAAFISANLSTALAVLAGAGVYAVTLILIKGITSEEILMLPKGDKLVKILKKIKLVK
jgi:stage V sporulation protein B